MRLNISVQPLRIRFVDPNTKRNAKTKEFSPVVMGGVRPSGNADLWAKFVSASSMPKAIDLTQDQFNAVRFYMEQNGTQAISEDGIKAFTVAHGRLVQCDPDSVYDPSKDDVATPI